MDESNPRHEIVLSALKAFKQPASALDIANEHQLSPSIVTRALKDLSNQKAVKIVTESAGPAYHKYSLV